MLHPDLVVNILRVAPVDFLWREYCLLTKSAFYLELRNPYIIGELYNQWNIECKCKNITRFFLEFDKKYFLNFSYTTYEYREDRVTRGFGATRLFKFAFLQGKITRIIEYPWLADYFSKYFLERPELIGIFGYVSYYDVLKRGFDKNFSDEKILKILDSVSSIMTPKGIMYLKSLISTFSIAYNRPSLQLSDDINYDRLAQILDDPQYLDNNFPEGLYTKCPNIIRSLGIKRITHDVICTQELCDYFSEIETYLMDICYSATCGIKLLVEKGLYIDLSRVKAEGALYLYKIGKITKDEFVEIVKRDNCIREKCNPDILLELSQHVFIGYDIPRGIKSTIDKLIK